MLSLKYEGSVYVRAKVNRKKKNVKNLVAKKYEDRKTLLQKELISVLEELGVDFSKGHFNPGYTSSMFGTGTHYIEVKYHPYPRIVYEIGAPTGAMGESIYTTDRDVAIKRGLDVVDV